MQENRLCGGRRPARRGREHSTAEVPERTAVCAERVAREVWNALVVDPLQLRFRDAPNSHSPSSTARSRWCRSALTVVSYRHIR